MSTTIEVKATFKSINIKDKTTLQFELSPRHEGELPNLTRVANTVVFLTISSEQQPLPIEDVEAGYEEQEELPIDDIDDDLDEATLLPGGDDYYPDEPFAGEDGEL